jgi:hypothetical protein
MNSSDCIKIDWYLCDITESGAYYNCEYMFSEYIGACNQCLEPPGDSGGYEEYIEIEKRKQMQWTVFMPDSHAWRVDAWDALKGRAGIFTGIIARGSLASWSCPYYWREDSHVGSYSGTAANSAVGGSFLNGYQGSVAFTVEKSQLWYYSDVF